MVKLPRNFSMRLGRKILLLAGICLAIGVASAIVISVSSVVKLKNELSHFHDEFEISEDRVEPVEIRYNALSFQLPFGFVIDGLQFNMATTAADEQIRITVEHLSTQLQGLPAGTLKSIARNIRLASANPDKPLLREKYRIHHIDVHFVEYETMVSLLDLESSMRRVYNHLSEILERGDTNELLSLQGTVFFEFEQNAEPFRLKQRFGTRKSGDISRIVLNREDLDLVGAAVRGSSFQGRS